MCKFINAKVILLCSLPNIHLYKKTFEMPIFVAVPNHLPATEREPASSAGRAKASALFCAIATSSHRFRWLKQECVFNGPLS